MARCAGAALLGAIEIYNKPTVEYREQTFAMLITNAWEVLLKARIVQLAGGRINAIYRRERGSNRIDRDRETQDPRTITMRQCLSIVTLPGEVAGNIKGLVLIRNNAVHLGILASETRQKVLEFGSASVQNFTKISRDWFGETIEVPYLLPLGFVGDATVVRTSLPGSQRTLLAALDKIARSSADTAPSDYSVILHIEIALNRGLTGGANIGMTNDPSVLRVSVVDDEVLNFYTISYGDLVAECRQRYPGFKQNAQFNLAMKRLQEDPNCAYERRLDPHNPTGQKKRFYNLDASVARLNAEYGYAKQIG